MKRALEGCCVLTLAFAAYQGLETYMEHQHARDFEHALTAAKVMRFGEARRSRLDIWFEEKHGQSSLSWTRLPRGWLQRDVPMQLDVSAPTQSARYHFAVNLDDRTLRPLDEKTRALEIRVRKWAEKIK